MTTLAIRNEAHYLATVSEVRALVERIEHVADARDLADKARAAQVWAQRAKLGREKVNLAATAKLYAERRTGELLAQMPKNRGAEGIGTSAVTRRDRTREPATLADLGVTKHESSRWQKLAGIPDFDQIVDELVSEGVVSVEAVLKKSGRRTRNRAAKQHAQEAVDNARREIGQATTPPYLLEHADIREWRPTGITAIITDPPYITDDAVDLHAALADFAVDTLPEGGALAVMTWQPLLPAVFAAMKRDSLVYRWTAAWLYDTPERTPERTQRVFDGWKPILVYHKTTIPPDCTYLYDTVRSPSTDKAHHVWGQSVDGFRQLVRAFTQPGDIVCDPFLGGGTTAIAALTETRRFIGCDINSEAVAATTTRLSA